MKLTNSLEEYLKTIYILEKSSGKVRVTDIAEKLKITKPSVNRAIKNLRDLDLIEYEVYGDINLTYQGEEKAKEIIKKHDIIKMFLIDIKGISAINIGMLSDADLQNIRQNSAILWHTSFRRQEEYSMNILQG